jgi:hypothetical protein
MFLLQRGSKNVILKKLHICNDAALKNNSAESTQLADPQLRNTAVSYRWVGLQIFF